MNAIIFFKTKELEKITEFYQNRVGCELWLEQGDCRIFKFGNMLLGFCLRAKVDKDGIITFFYNRKEAVDEAYQQFKAIAEHKPRLNPKYRIYHFFARDPEGRSIEFQWFQDKMKSI